MVCYFLRSNYITILTNVMEIQRLMSIDCSVATTVLSSLMYPYMDHGGKLHKLQAADLCLWSYVLVFSQIFVSLAVGVLSCFLGLLLGPILCSFVISSITMFILANIRKMF